MECHVTGVHFNASPEFGARDIAALGNCGLTVRKGIEWPERPAGSIARPNCRFSFARGYYISTTIVPAGSLAREQHRIT